MEEQERTTSADQVYQAIKSAIFDRNFYPGEVLSERRLSNELGVSRTPVRQALLRLYQEGLLERGPQNAFRLTMLTRGDVEEVFEVREWLEGLTARRAALRVRADDEARRIVQALKDELLSLRHSFEQGDLKSEFQFDLKLHATLMRISGNTRIETIINQMNAQIHHVRIRSKSDERTAETIDEHLAILQAVLEGDPDWAESTMRRHVQKAQGAAAEIVEEQRPPALRDYMKSLGGE